MLLVQKLACVLLRSTDGCIVRAQYDTIRLTSCGISNTCIGYVPGVTLRNSQNLPTVLL